MDFALDFNNGFFDLIHSDGEIISSDGIVESVITTLFLDDKWWGNNYSEDKIGSDIPRKKAILKNNLISKESFKKSIDLSLSWLKKDGIAKEITSEINESELIILHIDDIKLEVKV